MTNSNVGSSSNTITYANANGHASLHSTQAIGPCTIHGTYNCNCRNSSIVAICPSCGSSNSAGNLHQCTGTFGGTVNTLSFCYSCNTMYNISYGHVCSGSSNHTYGVPTYTGTTTSTWTAILPKFVEVKEITTDIELIYEWNGSTFDMRLPDKFSDCFLKVGASWSPLYPLIFSAIKNDEKELSFHLVVGIMDKTFEGGKVILKSVTTTKIEDNLTLMQLANQTKSFFKKDEE